MFYEVLLPVANIIVNPIFVIVLGIVGGFFSSFLGIGSGVIVTPCLIMFQIPPFIAVTSQLHASVGTNFMGFLAYWNHRDVDFNLAWYIFLGGFIGAAAEIYILDWLQSTGVMKNFLNSVCVGVLFFLGILLIIQNVRSALKGSKGPKYATMKKWMIYVPYHRIFTRSRVEISMIIPILVGFVTGVLTSTLGGGNSMFIMPIVSYLIGRSSPVVAGTSLLSGALISISVTLMHAVGRNTTGDIVLIGLIILGSYFGSRLGVSLRYRMPHNILSIVGGGFILLIAYGFSVNMSKLSVDKLISYSYSFVRGVSNTDTCFYDVFFNEFSKNMPLLYSLTSIAIVLMVSFLLNKLSQKIDSNISTLKRNI